MTEPIWLKRVWVDAIRFRQLQRFGGLYGVRDAGAIDSALARPRNQWGHQDERDLAVLAAAYGFGLTRGHGYVEGNKRVGFAAMAVFLDINGWDLEALEPEVVEKTVVVASGALAEAELAAWVRRQVQARSDRD
jgi:death on curing protein